MTSKDYYFDSYAHFGIHEVSILLGTGILSAQHWRVVQATFFPSRSLPPLLLHLCTPGLLAALALETKVSLAASEAGVRKLACLRPHPEVKACWSLPPSSDWRWHCAPPALVPTAALKDGDLSPRIQVGSLGKESLPPPKPF